MCSFTVLLHTEGFFCENQEFRSRKEYLTEPLGADGSVTRGSFGSPGSESGQGVNARERLRAVRFESSRRMDRKIVLG